MTPEQRSLRARTAAYAAHAKHGSRRMTAKARRARDAQFEAIVDPSGRLTAEERGKRAGAARRAHMLSMAQRSAQVRRARGSRSSKLESGAEA